MTRRRISRGRAGLRRQVARLSKGSAHGTLSAHRPLIMELMLWLMMRSAVLRSSGDFGAASDDEDGDAAGAIFGFALVHLAASQG